MARRNDKTTNIDTLAGEKIKELRIATGMSRVQLAQKIDVTHQQLQKYENGSNRISLGRMVLVCQALKKPMEYFIEGAIELPDEHQRMCIEVSRNFLKIKSPSHRAAVNHLVKTLVE